MDEIDIADAWDVADEPFDPTEASDKDEAVFIGQQATGDTVVVGNEESGEWLYTFDMGPLELTDCR